MRIIKYDPGFNRDIVECKVAFRKNAQWSSMDLIETLWNVKRAKRRDIHLFIIDLIETLWNVKALRSRTL